MIRHLVILSVTWAFLMAVAGAEFVVSGQQLGISNRPVLLAFAAVMVLTVVFVYMRLWAAPTVAKGFAVAAVFWLIVLFGFGSMDALTRSWFPVQHYNPK